MAVDASFAFRLLVPGPQQDSFRSQVARWLRDGYELYAPRLWLYEMKSALYEVVRFGELTLEEGECALALAQPLGILLVSPDDDQARSAFEWTLRLGRTAAYDSFYLALAEKLQWTADPHLRNAVDQPWVRLAGDS